MQKHYDMIIHTKPTPNVIGLIGRWYVWDKPFQGTKIKEDDFERAEELLKRKGIYLNDTNYVSNSKIYDTTTFLWNGAITYFQRSTEPLTLANNQGIIVSGEQMFTRPTHLITIVGEHGAKIRNTAYRLGLPLEDIL